MKLACFVFALVVGGAFSLPLDLDDHRWSLVRDGEGKMHLLDLNPVDAEVEPAFDAETDTFFLLFTRDNPTAGQRITWSLESIEQSPFRRGAPVRVLAHGWGSSSASGENPRATREFLALGDYNVIVTDWSVGAGAANYITARNRVGVTGAVVARLLNFLQENNYASHSNVHVVGHSLGAHVAGHVGKNVEGGRINAIFGTDPAGKKLLRGSFINFIVLLFQLRSPFQCKQPRST
jgi:pancreatic triacylglycerol lipase